MCHTSRVNIASAQNRTTACCKYVFVGSLRVVFEAFLGVPATRQLEHYWCITNIFMQSSHNNKQTWTNIGSTAEFVKL